MEPTKVLPRVFQVVVPFDAGDSEAGMTGDLFHGVSLEGIVCQATTDEVREVWADFVRE